MNIADEIVSVDKNSDLVCPLLADYISGKPPAFGRYVRTYLDFAPYFKFKFVGWWATKMLYTGRFRRMIISSMVPENTESAPDAMLAQTAHRFYRPHAFTTKELLDMMHSFNLKPKGLSLSLSLWKALNDE